ncbi:hypothetical protein HK102_012836, partial [Quaeritorhiza haematococci]
MVLPPPVRPPHYTYTPASLPSTSHRHTPSFPNPNPNSRRAVNHHRPSSPRSSSTSSQNDYTVRRGNIQTDAWRCVGDVFPVTIAPPPHPSLIRPRQLQSQAHGHGGGYRTPSRPQSPQSQAHGHGHGYGRRGERRTVTPPPVLKSGAGYNAPASSPSRKPHSPARKSVAASSSYQPSPSRHPHPILVIAPFRSTSPAPTTTPTPIPSPLPSPEPPCNTTPKSALAELNGTPLPKGTPLASSAWSPAPGDISSTPKVVPTKNLKNSGPNASDWKPKPKSFIRSP